MANPFFKFKQFTVFHDKCAMKVGTDGVLLGAWVSVKHAKTILDIGSGSGLISLMIAQRNPNTNILAIDPEEDAIIQTNINFKSSPFQDRLASQCISLQDYAQVCTSKFDLIVSNPPFFNQSLKSPDDKRTLARHTDSLSIEELITISKYLLSPIGKLSIIYPYSELNQILKTTELCKLYISRVTTIYPTPYSAAKRVLVEISMQNCILKENNLILEVERHKYTNEFVDLLKDFYLQF